VTIEEIYQGMLGIFQKETGLSLAGDGDMAVRLYAVAAQIYALYVQADWVGRQCFPQTAQGDFLDKHAQLRNLERRAAVAARGVLRFERDTAAATDLSIPAGTVCLTAGQIRFETESAAVLRAGATAVEVRARALEGGAAGNVAAGAVRAMAMPPVGISRCTNPQAFTGGADPETDEALRERVLETYRRMPNGANAAFYQQGAMSFPEVAAATVIPRPRGIGTVDVVVATAAGLPDSALLARLKEYFQARREIAVEVQVQAPQVKTVNVTVSVTPEDGMDKKAVVDAVKTRIQTWFDGRLLGQNILRARLGALIYAVDGVKNYAITAPAADVAVSSRELPRLGSLKVTEGTA